MGLNSAELVQDIITLVETMPIRYSGESDPVMCDRELWRELQDKIAALATYRKNVQYTPK